MRVFVLAIGQRALTLKPLVGLKLVEIAAAAVIQRIRIVVGFSCDILVHALRVGCGRGGDSGARQ